MVGITRSRLLKRIRWIEIAIANQTNPTCVIWPFRILAPPADGILQCDLYADQQLRQRQIPAMMLLSGGYSRASYQSVVGRMMLDFE